MRGQEGRDAEMRQGKTHEREREREQEGRHGLGKTYERERESKIGVMLRQDVTKLMIKQQRLSVTTEIITV